MVEIYFVVNNILYGGRQRQRHFWHTRLWWSSNIE